MRLLAALFAGVILNGPAAAGPPAAVPTADELASVMRSLLTAALPSPLVAQDVNWGHQKEVTNGITWDGVGPRRQKKFQNDGVWRRIRVEAVNPDKSLVLVVKNVAHPAKGTVTFDMLVSLPTRITFEQQYWVRGTRLYSGETRARCRPVLLLKCETTSRAVKTGGLLPDVVFRMRVLAAHLDYTDFKVEHTAGVGGEAAEILGNALLDTIKTIRPSLEKDLKEKANRAIVKAGDTKEVRLGLGNLLDGK